LFLATDNEGKMIFHVAAESRELEVIRGIFNWAKENIKTENVFRHR
jgi:hypothetical protein